MNYSSFRTWLNIHCFLRSRRDQRCSRWWRTWRLKFVENLISMFQTKHIEKLKKLLIDCKNAVVKTFPNVLFAEEEKIWYHVGCRLHFRCRSKRVCVKRRVVIKRKHGNYILSGSTAGRIKPRFSHSFFQRQKCPFFAQLSCKPKADNVKYCSNEQGLENFLKIHAYWR